MIQSQNQKTNLIARRAVATYRYLNSTLSKGSLSSPKIHYLYSPEETRELTVNF
jgi:hypothetical protein